MLDKTEAPTIRLAHAPGAQGDNVLKGVRGVKRLDRNNWPSLLVSFAYLRLFEKCKADYVYRDWALDSGAYSAQNSGKVIDLEKYIETCRHLTAHDRSLVEVFGLDVIGDWRATLKNVKAMWKAGIEAIPTFHYGQPEDVLVGIAKDYPKIAIGGAVGLHKKEKIRWASQCFARIWPKKIHGFGFGGESAILELPFHSVDATNWEVGSCKFGNWKTFGKMSVRGGEQDLRAEVEWYLDLERKARFRWKNEMKTLEEVPA